VSLPPDFVLPVDKPEGPTSHDVVGAVRRALGRRRVGHTGTLDPFASGLLLVCVGRATRLAEYLSGLDKVYEAVVRLGEATDTLDRDGQVIEVRDGWKDMDPGRIETALGRLRGRQEQVPPVYSAKKVAGEPAHRRVRRGENVELAPSTVTVHVLELTSLELPVIGLRVACSSGTYVRALARDIGDLLGVGAHLLGLRRTAIGGFGVAGALGVPDLENEEAVARAAVEPLRALRHLPTFAVDAAEAALLTHGQPIRLDDDLPGGLVAVAHEGSLLAVGQSSSGLLRPRKVFGS